MRDIHIDDSDTLLKEFNSLGNSYMYRGHSSSTWQLRTTLERCCGKKFSREFADKCEFYSLGQFKSKFHLYDKENAKPESLLEWLSLMQHYGVPTRLLDFTTSPYVALYFALEAYDLTARPDMAVYATNYSELMDVSLSLIAAEDNKFSETRQSINGRQDDIFAETIDRFNREILWVTEPQRLNARIDRQSGCFLVSGSKGLSVEDLLQSPKYASVDTRKYIISGGMFEHVFPLLRKMNVSGKSIYGDLFGLARSLALEFKIYAA